MDRTMIDREEIDPARTVVVATGNAHKLVEIEEILSTVLPDVRFVALGQLGEFEEPEENGATFFENALDQGAGRCGGDGSARHRR